MQQDIYFDKLWSDKWPDPSILKPYFLAPAGSEWFAESGNNSASISLHGLNGTAHLAYGLGRVDIVLRLWGRPGLGVLLIYEKIGGPDGFHYVSKGDMGKLGQYVRSTHDTPLPVAYFIPFAEAWKAVKEFMETEGQLPKSIEWVAGKDIPDNTFPDP